MPKPSSLLTRPYSVTQGMPKGKPLEFKREGSVYEERLIVGESDTDDSEKEGARSVVRHAEYSTPDDGFCRRYWVGDQDEIPNLRLALRRIEDDQTHLVVENKTGGGGATVELPLGDHDTAKKLLGKALKDAELDLEKTDYDHPDARVARVTVLHEDDGLQFIHIGRSVPYPYLDYSSDHPIDRKDPKVQKHDFDTMKYGFPGIEHPLFRNSTVLSYNPQHKNANWAAERINKYTLSGGADRSQAGFKAEADTDVAPEHKATLSDYRGSGFDRGHLAPAANHGKQKDLEETFLLANVSPQVGNGFNQQYWKGLESKVRNWGSGDDDLFVITGPAYLSEDGTRKKKREVSYQVIGDNEVSVPTHFFKAMLAERDTENGVEIRTQAFLIPNAGIDSKEPLEKYLVSVDELEKKTGLDFFNRLPDEVEEELEKETPTDLWGDEGWRVLHGR